MSEFLQASLFLQSNNLWTWLLATCDMVDFTMKSSYGAVLTDFCYRLRAFWPKVGLCRIGAVFNWQFWLATFNRKYCSVTFSFIANIFKCISCVPGVCRCYHKIRWKWHSKKFQILSILLDNFPKSMAKVYTCHTYYRESKNLKGNNGQTVCAMSINLYLFNKQIIFQSI